MEQGFKMRHPLGMRLWMLMLVWAASMMGQAPLQTVAKVDLQRYAGTWYEIARLPNKFQRQCMGDVTAQYTLLEDGRIDVVNRCRKRDGSMEEARGVARKADASDGSNARLEVRFAPAFLSFLPVWGDYQIIALDAEYRYAMVASRDRKYLWVLGREKSMSEQQYKQLLEQARGQGFVVEQVERTKQS